MPEELWDAAVELAEEESAFRIANELGVSYQTLKQRTEEARHRAPNHRGKAEFVEIHMGQALGREVADATEIEVARGDGARLRIRLGARERLNLEAVTAAFVGGSR
jgi:hypothetical protein